MSEEMTFYSCPELDVKEYQKLAFIHFSSAGRVQLHPLEICHMCTYVTKQYLSHNLKHSEVAQPATHLNPVLV